VKNLLTKERGRLLALQPLKNKYRAFRHGHALTNELSLLVSTPELDSHGFGLTNKGIEQVEQSFQVNFGDGNLSSDHFMLLSSPLARCRDSAVILQNLFKNSLNLQVPLLIREELADRNYGEFENTNAKNWEQLKKSDLVDPFRSDFSAESVAEMCQRLVSMVADLEGSLQDKTFILVSHCDTIQVLEALFFSTIVKHYSDINALDNAEMRCLTLQ